MPGQAYLLCFTEIVQNRDNNDILPYYNRERGFICTILSIAIEVLQVCSRRSVRTADMNVVKTTILSFVE